MATGLIILNSFKNICNDNLLDYNCMVLIHVFHRGWTRFYFMYDPKCSTTFSLCTINAPAVFAWCTNQFLHKVEFSYIGWNRVHTLILKHEILEPFQWLRCDLTIPEMPIAEVRQSYDSLISTMEIPMLVGWHIYTEIYNSRHHFFNVCIRLFHSFISSLSVTCISLYLPRLMLFVSTSRC